MRKLDGDDTEGERLFKLLAGHSEAMGCPVTVESIEGAANGFYVPDEHRIVVGDSLSPVQAAKTLCHEIAHSVLHRDFEVYRAHQGDCELEAESVAFIVLNHFGIDAGAYSFGYVTGWKGGDEAAIKALKASAQRIQVTAKVIIEGSEDESEGLLHA